jgi:CDP-4-dehydro-6-deoxyglucose reductase, E1
MLKLIKSTFYQEEQTKKELADFILKAKILSFGEQCLEFERNFAKWQGRKHCVMVNSGSSANLALVQALLNLNLIEKQDKVGFSALTWSTNVMPLIQLGLWPFPIDVSLDTLNVSPDTLFELLEKYKIKMLFLTNLLGFCDDIEYIRWICQQEGIILVEDNCESLGSEAFGHKLGNFGLASTFSFYVGHHMSTVEGGAICTDDDELADMLRIVRAHGWDRNLPKPKANPSFYSRYTFYDLGYNLRPTELQGFLGNQQLQFLDQIVDKRGDNFMELLHKTHNNSLYYPLKLKGMTKISNFAFPFVCKTPEIRDRLVKSCEEYIEIRPIVGGNMCNQPFFEKYAKCMYPGPNVELIHNQGLYVGNNPEMTEEDLDKIVSIFHA